MAIETLNGSVVLVPEPITSRGKRTRDNIDITKVTPESAPFLAPHLPTDSHSEQSSQTVEPSSLHARRVTQRRSHTPHPLPHQVEEQAALGNHLAQQAEKLAKKFGAHDTGVVYDYLLIKANARARRGR